MVILLHGHHKCLHKLLNTDFKISTSITAINWTQHVRDHSAEETTWILWILVLRMISTGPSCHTSVSASVAMQPITVSSKLATLLSLSVRWKEGTEERPESCSIFWRHTFHNLNLPTSLERFPHPPKVLSWGISLLYVSWGVDIPDSSAGRIKETAWGVDIPDPTAGRIKETGNKEELRAVFSLHSGGWWHHLLVKSRALMGKLSPAHLWVTQVDVVCVHGSGT